MNHTDLRQSTRSTIPAPKGMLPELALRYARARTKMRNYHGLHAAGISGEQLLSLATLLLCGKALTMSDVIWADQVLNILETL